MPQILRDYYGIQLYAARVGPTDRITNGHISVGPYILAICGAKNWNGHRDPEVEASAYVLEAIRKELVGSKKDPLDVLPCMVIYLVGGCLFPTCCCLLPLQRLAYWVFWDGPH